MTIKFVIKLPLLECCKHIDLHTEQIISFNIINTMFYEFEILNVIKRLTDLPGIDLRKCKNKEVFFGSAMSLFNVCLTD